MKVRDGVHYNKASRWISIAKRYIQKKEAMEFEKTLNILLSDSKKKPIIVFLSGEDGGDIYCCLNIVRRMEKSPAPIFTVAVGTLFSGFFNILQGGKKRFAAHNAKFAFHRSTTYINIKGTNAENLRQFYEYLSLLDAMQVIAFCKHGGSYEDIIGSFQDEEELSPKEALELKLIDEIIQRKSLNVMSKSIFKSLALEKKKRA